MIQNEEIITKWAPSLLQWELDEILWKDSNDIQIKKLWEYLCTYCYLPRLASYAVLEEAITQGLASDEYFGISAIYSAEKARYVDLKFNQTVFSINPSDLLVKPEIASAQKRKEAQEQEKPTTTDHAFVDSDRPGSGPTKIEPISPPTGKINDSSNAPAVLNRHFDMTVDLDPIRINKDVNQYVQEVIQHLTAIDGAKVRLTLTVEVDAENGIPASTVRTVSENCRTLKVTDFGFDD